MKLVFAGSGSPFTVGEENFQSNMFLEILESKKKLLLGCGGDSRLALHELGLNYRDFSDIYIAHLHSDQVGGLEWLGFTTKFDPLCKEKIRLHMNPAMIETLWSSILAGGLSSLQGIVADLATYFDVCPIHSKHPLVWEGINISFAEPVVNGSSNFKFLPYYGIFFKVGSQRVFISTDTELPSSEIIDLYCQSDLVFQNCGIVNPWEADSDSNYEVLKSLNMEIKKKLWLYNCGPDALRSYQSDGFRGVVKKGQSFDLRV